MPFARTLLHVLLPSWGQKSEGSIDIRYQCRMTTTLSLQTLRVPKGLWADLEETVIQQDRAFLSEVARSLGLPVAEVLRKVLGTGAPQPIAVLIGSPSEDPACCPWWIKSAAGCWAPCTRQRLNPTSACQIHLHAITGPTLGIRSDPRFVTLPTLSPVRYNGNIYWVSEDADTHVYREDGSIESDIAFKFIEHRGQRICVVVQA